MDEILEGIALALAEAYNGERATPTTKDREAAKSLIPILEDVALRAILVDRLSAVESAIHIDLEDL